MGPTHHPPIFCDHCASLAFALLDDAPLCAKCLQKVLSKGDSHLMKRIEPLVLSHTNERISKIPSTDSDTCKG